MIRRLVTIGLSASLVFGAVGAADAAKKKKKPVITTLYLHGAHQVGEANLPDSWLNDLYHEMNETEPDGAAPKSQFVTNYLVGPNPRCSGNGLLPVWRTPMAGTISGDVKATIHTAATPGARLVIELYPDGAGGCTTDNPVSASNEWVEPVAAVIVEVPPGHGVLEVTFEGVKAKVLSHLLLQVKPDFEVTAPDEIFAPGQVRLLYDSADMASSLEVPCIPASGSSCIPS